jgi:hypothetical protein
MPRVKKNTLIHFETDTNKPYINNASRKVYLFDKRTKVETPSKAYLRILEETLKAGHPALYHLNTKTLNSIQVIALLSRYDIDVPKYHNETNKIRRSF